MVDTLGAQVNRWIDNPTFRGVFVDRLITSSSRYREEVGMRTVREVTLPREDRHPG